MNVITVFNPKGGTGKTTAVMGIASGLIEAGDRVAVLDISEPDRSRLTGSRFLPAWEDAMVATGIGADRLVTAPAKTGKNMGEVLYGFAKRGFDHILIDTGTYPDQRTARALDHSKLVIAPFRFAPEAAWVSNWVAENGYRAAPVVGLSTGMSHHCEEARLARSTFIAGPVFRANLPHCHLLDTQMECGHLFTNGRRKDFAPDDWSPEALAYRWEAYAARAEVMKLCLEIVEILRTGKPRGYSHNRPLAQGDAFAHLRALLEVEELAEAEMDSLARLSSAGVDRQVVDAQTDEEVVKASNKDL
jgi:hypothetical protein